MPSRLAAVVVPVCVVGSAVAVAAAVSLAAERHSAAAFAGIGAFFAASMLSARFPVPLDGLDTGGVSLGFVFAVGAIVLFGWDAGVIVTRSKSFASSISRTTRHGSSTAANRSGRIETTGVATTSTTSSSNSINACMSRNRGSPSASARSASGGLAHPKGSRASTPSARRSRIRENG